MTQSMIAAACAPLLASLSEKHDLVWRDHRVRVSVPAAVGGQPIPGPFQIPAQVPFLITDLGWSSIRPYDGQIVDVSFRSRDRTFVDPAEPLELLCNRINAGGNPADVPPMFLRPSEEVIFSFLRFFPIDPAEIYPGPANDSIITVRMRGCEIWPLGSQMPKGNPT